MSVNKRAQETRLTQLPDPVAFAVAEGNLELLEALKRSRGLYNWAFTPKTVVQAGRSGQREVAQWLLENDLTGGDLVPTSGQIDWTDWVRSTELSTSFYLYMLKANAKCGNEGGLESFIASGKVTYHLDCCLMESFNHILKSRYDVDYHPRLLGGNRRADLEWMKRVVDLGLHYCPEKFAYRDLLVLWTCRYAYGDIIERLIELGYLKSLSRSNFKHLLLATRDGKLVQATLEREPKLLTAQVFRWAAKRNTQVPLLKFLFDHLTATQSEVKVRRLAHNVIAIASKYGCLKVLKWMYHNVSRPSTVTSPWKSATFGHVHILQWLHDTNIMDESKLSELMHACVRFGQLRVLKWFQDTGFELQFSLQDLQYAVGRGHVNIVDWILTSDPSLQYQNLEFSREVDAFVRNSVGLVGFLQ